MQVPEFKAQTHVSRHICEKGSHEIARLIAVEVEFIKTWIVFVASDECKGRSNLPGLQNIYVASKIGHKNLSAH